MEVNRACDQIYGILLQSYTLVFMNVVLFTILKFVAENFLLPTLLCVLGFKKQIDPNLLKSSLKTIDSESNSPSAVSIEMNAKSDTEEQGRLDVEIAFMLVQTIFAITSFVISCISVDSSMSRWDQYQHFYGMVLNSSILTLFISSFFFLAEHVRSEDAIKENELYGRKPVFLKKGTFEYNFASFTWIGSSVVLLPPFCTHVLPGLVTYFWIMLIFMFIIGNVYKFFSALGDRFDRTPIVLEYKLKLKYILVRLMILLALQTMYNYMYLFYQVHPAGVVISAEQYIGVVAREYALRTQTYCQFHQGTNNLVNAMVFFNWL